MISRIFRCDGGKNQQSSRRQRGTTGKHTPDHSPELKDQRNATVLYVFGL
jgi:hypothetical protein